MKRDIEWTDISVTRPSDGQPVWAVNIIHRESFWLAIWYTGAGFVPVTKDPDFNSEDVTHWQGVKAPRSPARKKGKR